MSSSSRIQRRTSASWRAPLVILTLLPLLTNGCATSGTSWAGSSLKTPPCDGVAVSAGSDLNAVIEQAELGDVLCLAAGTYQAPIFISSSLTLAAADSGPVILDAGGQGTTISIDAPTSQVSLRGLTVIGGKAAAVGGGIRIAPGAEVSIQRCVLSGNEGGAEGGGALYASGARVRMDQTRIVGNRSEAGSSALLLDGRSQLVMRASLIAENVDMSSGLIRLLDGAQIQVFGSTIANNQAPWAIEFGGTAARHSSLHAHGSILSHQGGPILWVIDGARPPQLRVQATVLHGDASQIAPADNHLSDPRLDASYRPASDSVARGQLRALPANWSSRDLLGALRPTTPTLGAIE